MPRRDPLAAAAAAADLAALEQQPQAGNPVVDLNKLSNPGRDEELLEVVEEARLLATMAIACCRDPDAVDAVADTTRIHGLSSMDNHNRDRPWHDVPGAMRAAIARVQFCITGRPSLCHRLLGAETVALLQQGLERYYERAHNGIGHPGSAYVTAMIGRRCWTSRDFPRARPWPDAPPSFRDIWRRNRRIVRSWSADKRARVMARLMEMVGNGG